MMSDSATDLLNDLNVKEAKLERVYETLNTLEKELATGELDQDELEYELQLLVNNLENLDELDVENDALASVSAFVMELADENERIQNALLAAGETFSRRRLEQFDLSVPH